MRISMVGAVGLMVAVCGFCLGFGCSSPGTKTPTVTSLVETNIVVVIQTNVVNVTDTNTVTIFLGTSFTNAAAQCDAEIDSRLAKLKTEYLAQLSELQTTYQKHGELDSALAAKNEINRFGFEKRITDQPVVARPVELRALQEKLLRTPKTMQQQIAQDYGRNLEVLKNCLLSRMCG